MRLIAAALAGALAGYVLAMRLRLPPPASVWGPLREALVDAGIDEFCRRRGARGARR